jgi:hypothetical protein
MLMNFNPGSINLPSQSIGSRPSKGSISPPTAVVKVAPADAKVKAVSPARQEILQRQRATIPIEA